MYLNARIVRTENGFLLIASRGEVEYAFVALDANAAKNEMSGLIDKLVSPNVPPVPTPPDVKTPNDSEEDM